MNSLPSLSELVASKLMFSTISPFFTYSRGTCTVSSTSTATYGVKPLSVHHSYSARIRYGRVDVDSSAFIVRYCEPQATPYLRMTFSDGVSASM